MEPSGSTKIVLRIQCCCLELSVWLESCYQIPVKNTQNSLCCTCFRVHGMFTSPLLYLVLHKLIFTDQSWLRTSSQLPYTLHCLCVTQAVFCFIELNSVKGESVYTWKCFWDWSILPFQLLSVPHVSTILRHKRIFTETSAKRHKMQQYINARRSLSCSMRALALALRRKRGRERVTAQSGRLLNWQILPCHSQF